MTTGLPLDAFLASTSLLLENVGHRRAGAALRRVVASEMIDKVLCFSFYQTIREQLVQLVGYTRED
jgi:hypothetical protein